MLIWRILKRYINPSNWRTGKVDIDQQWVYPQYEFVLSYITKNDLVLDTSGGSDLSSQNIGNKAQKVIMYAKRANKKDNIDCQKFNLFKMPFKDNTFDKTLGIGPNGDIKNYSQYLNELSRVTKNNGLIIITNKLLPTNDEKFFQEELKRKLQKYFIINGIYGLRAEIQTIEKIEGIFCQYAAYLAICSNRKYILQDYNDAYFEAVHNGISTNPVAQYHLTAVANSIIGTSVLAIGCGTCTHEKSIIQLRPNIILTGTDIYTSDYLDKLRKENGLQNFIKVSAHKDFKQPFKDNFFDTVYTSHVLEHVQSPEKLIFESIRLAKHLAMHLVPINLDNPDHINFFKFGDIDNEFKTQEANIDLKQMCEKIVTDCKNKYPSLYYEMEIINPRDGSIDYGDIDFIIKKTDRPDGLMPCFLIKFYKNG